MEGDKFSIRGVSYMYMNTRVQAPGEVERKKATYMNRIAAKTRF